MNYPEDAIQIFVLECRELLESMESALLALEHSDDTSEPVNAIFRAAHTIKGSAGLFALDRIISFTHAVESVLDHMRSGELPVSRDLVSLLLRCADHIALLVDALEAGTLTSDDSLSERGQPMVQALLALLGVDNVQSPAPCEPEAIPVEVIPAPDQPLRDTWHISLRFNPNVLRIGLEPLAFIRYLNRIGQITAIVTLPDALPSITEMDPESCYLGFEIALRSDASKQTIEDVFEFVVDDCQIRILPPDSRITDYIRLIEELPEDNARIGDILLSCGSITSHELATALQQQESARAQGDEVAAIGEILVDQSAVQAPVVDAALARQKQMRDNKSQESRTIRVDADKLDELINLVGELIIAAASTDLHARQANVAGLHERTSTLTGLVESVRDSALQLRMVKIGASFNRFQRVIYEVSRELGKDIILEIRGEDTELDKTVVEKIADPLTHLVRNAIDHGIEPVEERLARGKSALGCIRLNAFHDSGSIVIEVSDDGGGLKRERIFAKAVERGLIAPTAVLSDSEVCDLIFEPGFSTADQITNLSGRGVGMDVVKKNITALRGSVNAHSEEGVGTTMQIRLPLTLAIIDGFLVSVGGSVFVIPLDMIEECIDLPAALDSDYTNLRGEVLPFIRLRHYFDLGGSDEGHQNIVVVKHAGHRFGLMVDTLLGEFQTVIKPLGKIFSHIKCLSGSTILGDGKVALILDIAALFSQIDSAATHHTEQRERIAHAA
ncbi:MAG: chemotaxis protein CheA [Rhodocyclaceae bacterium]